MEAVHTSDSLPVDKKWLSQLNFAELKLIEKRLNNISGAIGISGVTDLQVMELICKALPQYYPRFTMEKITVAFLENAAGQLDCKENGKEIEKFIPYNSFDWNFVCNVLNAYQATERRKNAEPPRPSPSFKSLPEAEMMTIYKANYISILQICKQLGKIPEQGNFWQCFVYAKESGRMDRKAINFDQVMKETFTYVNQQADLLQKPDDRRGYRREHAKGTPLFQNLCRERYFKIWLQNKLTENADENGDFSKWIHSEIIS